VLYTLRTTVDADMMQAAMRCLVSWQEVDVQLVRWRAFSSRAADLCFCMLASIDFASPAD
jgi:hypothetical protein